MNNTTTIQLKHRTSDAVLFQCEVPDTTPFSLRVRYALEKAVEARACLISVNLSGAKLYEANLRGADLRDANLRGANLRGAYLSGANLTGADLRGVNLRGANLRGANLSVVDLSGANLTGADLRDAYLRGVNLRGVNLSGANLTGADLPRTTPAQAIENLDAVRAILLSNSKRLDMDRWHEDNDWLSRTCAEEVSCDTTHCLAGWLQVCTPEASLKKIDPQLAGILAAPVAAKMFYQKKETVMAWLKSRAYVEESEESAK